MNNLDFLWPSTGKVRLTYEVQNPFVCRNMFKKLVDPFVILPLGMLVYLCVAGPEFGDWRIDWGIRGVAACFLIGMALSSIFEFNAEETSLLNTVGANLSKVFFGIVTIAFLCGFSYCVFFLMQPDGFTPVWLVWGFRIFFILFVGLPLTFFAVDYARKRKGSVVVETVTDEFEFGDTIFGAVQLRLNRSVQVNQVCVDLIGFERIHIRTDANGHRFVEEHDRFRKTQVLDIKDKNLVGDQNFMEFKFDLKGRELADLLNSTSNVFWKIVSRVDCPGLDLTGVSRITIHQESSMDE